MPWLTELETARALAAGDGTTRGVGQVRRDTYFGGIAGRDPELLLATFAATPALDDPRIGPVSDRDSFLAYVHETRAWLDRIGEGIDPIRLTVTERRTVEEVSIRLRGDHPELPVAVVADLDQRGLVEAIRVYHSTWPLTGRHKMRPPLLSKDPSIALSGAPADYQRGLATGDKSLVLAAFEPGAVVREPAGGPYSYSGEDHARIYDVMFANGGGIPLDFCTVTDDGTACVIEYNGVQWGRDRIPPQAGVAAYERGPSGLLAAARIYDDVTPPESSDSSV